MLKKLLSLLLVLSMLLTLSISLVSWDDKDEDNGKGENNSDKNDDKNDGDEPEVPAKVTYTVTVVDQNGDPVEGAAVQMCDDKGCKMPAATNANGVVTFTYDPSNYHVTIVECPAGYTADPEQAFYFEGEATELTVEITKD